MMLEILNRKISTPLGIIILLLVATFVGGMIIRQYKKVMEIRLESIEIEVFGEPLDKD